MIARAHQCSRQDGGHPLVTRPGDTLFTVVHNNVNGRAHECSKPGEGQRKGILKKKDR